MKKALPFALILVLLLTLAIGCKAQEISSAPVPPTNGGPEAVMIELSYDDFTSQNHITRDVELIVPGSLIVNLYSNPTTGYQWSEAQISVLIIAPSVIEQDSHNFVEPLTGMPVVGAGGKDVWVFNSLAPGIATIKCATASPGKAARRMCGLLR
jgi:predicted secreted protein